MGFAMYSMAFELLKRQGEEADPDEPDSAQKEIVMDPKLCCEMAADLF